MSRDNPARLQSGGLFHGDYRIVGCLSSGGMGAIYEVLHLRTKRRRALKVMLPSVVTSDELRARFALEATVASAVESAHIAEVLDAGVDEETGSPFIVMELLRGESLADLLERKETLPAADVVTYLAHAAFALEKAHAAGIVHRDLKPDNLFVTYLDDGTPCVKVLDFGIAKVMDENKTQHTAGILGTPLYISPEQVHGRRKITPGTDVYSLGQIAYTLLTGEPYWKKEHQDTGLLPFLVQVMEGKQQPASERALERTGVALPPGFDHWFDRATASASTDCHAGLLALVTALADVLGVPFAPPSTELPRAVASLPPPSVGKAGETSEASAGGERRELATAEEPAVVRATEVASSGSQSTVAATDKELARAGALAAQTDTTSSYLTPPIKRSRWPLVAVGAALLATGVYLSARDWGAPAPTPALASSPTVATVSPSPTSSPARIEQAPPDSGSARFSATPPAPQTPAPAARQRTPAPVASAAATAPPPPKPAPAAPTATGCPLR